MDCVSLMSPIQRIPTCLVYILLQIRLKQWHWQTDTHMLLLALLVYISLMFPIP